MQLDSSKKFTSVFRLEVDKDDQPLINAVYIEGIKYYKNSSEIHIRIVSDAILSYGLIESLEKQLRKNMNVNYVEIIQKDILRFDEDNITDDIKSRICSYLNHKVAMTRTILPDSIWTKENEKLVITLKRPGIDFMKEKNCSKIIEDFLSRNYNSNTLKVIFKQDVDKVLLNTEDYTKQKFEMEKEKVKEIVTVSSPSQEKEIKRKKKAPLLTQQGSKIIVGKNITEEIIDISSISLEKEKAVIEGKVTNLEARQTQSGKYLVSIDIYDTTGSITVKMFLSKEKYEEMWPKIAVDKTLRVKGIVQYDKFTKEVIIMANDIMEFDVIKKTDNAEVKRVELHLHTQMSSMDAINPVHKLVERAGEWGHKAIAITDHGVVQAFPEAYLAGKKHNVKIIYGTECYLVDGETVKGKDVISYHAIILVKNYVGLKNLYKIISESHLNNFYKKPRMPKKLIEQYREGLILGTACESGELYNAIATKKSEEEIERIIEFYDYLEVQPLGNNEFMIREGTATQSDLIDNNKKIIELGEKHNKLVVATCDVHFMDAEEEVFRRILMSGQGYTDADRQAGLFYRTTDEMLGEFTYLDKEKAFEIVVTNTNKIADWIEELVPIPQKTFPPKIEGAEKEIEKLAMEKAKEIYGEKLPEVVKSRLDKELNSIIKNGFSVMYIIAQKLVAKSLSDGYLVGSRGSVGSSFVATMSGITEVNPLPAHYVCTHCKYSEFPETKCDCGVDMQDKECPNCGTLLYKNGTDIPFETFLGFDCDKEPDIDLNFSGEYQSKAHKYVEELFGEGHVFRAGTIATIADKTAYGFVRNYLEERNISVFNAEINRLVRGCTGIKRTTGQHPGGVMIVPQDNEIYEFCPVQHPADDNNSNVITTHFDYHSIHGTLLKLDILGHDDPTMIKMLEDLTGIDARGIPIDDKKTMGIFTSTEPLGIKAKSIHSEVGTFGVPEFGTKFVRQMLVDTKPTTFSELVKISGLSHGTNVWLNNAQEIVRSGTAKLSEVICTRDDIMLYLIKKGMDVKTAFKIMEDVRKGKGLKAEYEEEMKKNRVPHWYIDSCNKIKYMFPKAHAAAYVIMALRIAYFKVHYPEAFYSAYFSIRADDFDAELMANGPDKVKNFIKELENKGNGLTVKEKSVLTVLEVVNEMYERNIKFLPVDLYISHATKFKIEDGAIRPPLKALQGLGEVAANNIADTRKEQKFLSKDELRMRSKLSKTVIEILERNGCLAELPESNQLSLF